MKIALRELYLVMKTNSKLMGNVPDEHLTLLYFILLTLLAVNYDLLLTLQFYIVKVFDVLFDCAL